MTNSVGSLGTQRNLTSVDPLLAAGKTEATWDISHKLSFLQPPTSPEAMVLWHFSSEVSRSGTTPHPGGGRDSDGGAGGGPLWPWCSVGQDLGK